MNLPAPIPFRDSIPFGPGQAARRRRLVLFLGALLLAPLGHAQQLSPLHSPLAPKPVPPIKKPQSVPTEAVPPSVPDAEVLLPALQGLVFVPVPADVIKKGLDTKGVEVRNVPVPAPPAFKALVSPYLDKKLTHGGLNQLIAQIITFYRNHDRPIVDVIVPEQDIATGTVQLVILEGRVGQISTTGNLWFSNREIRNGMSIRTGDPIRASQLQSDLDALNANAFHTTDIIYRPGEDLGSTDLILKTQDRFPLRPYIGYENSGNATTGFDRYEAGFNWGDAFHLGLGQQMNYQYTTSGDGESLRSHSGSYVIPLPWDNNTLTFFGNYVDTKGTIPPLFDLVGRSYQISGRYGIPLPAITLLPKLTYKHSFQAGFDYKYNNNTTIFASIPNPGVYTVDQFILAYNGTESDPYGQTTINDQLSISPGHWGAANTDADYNTAHTGAESSYVYNTLILERLTRLPFDFSLVLRGTVQSSNSNLVPSEQLGFGGYDTIRGYEEREVNTDEGFIFTTEVHTPTVSLGEFFGCKPFKDQLQFLGFWDYGNAYNHSPYEGSETPLSSVGAGVRYSIDSYVSFRFDYGFQLLATPFGTGPSSRGNIGIVLSY